jgi:hypothetical protein
MFAKPIEIVHSSEFAEDDRAAREVHCREHAEQKPYIEGMSDIQMVGSAFNHCGSTSSSPLIELRGSAGNYRHFGFRCAMYAAVHSPTMRSRTALKVSASWTL